MFRRTCIGLLIGFLSAPGGNDLASATELTILWADWDPANYLQELVNEYEKETGIKVTVETAAWPDYQTKAFAEFNAKGDAYDMIVGDSQWLGAASTGGHYVELTDFVAKHEVAKLMVPATLQFYAEYPGNSGRYWAIPLEGDAIGWAYRKDWFEDAKEMRAFKARYGYDLSPPKSFKEMRDIAEFFHRPDEKKYGIGIYTDNSTDALAGGFGSVLFSYGGDFGDYATYQVEGIVNSDQAVAALEAYKELYQFTPPGWASANFVEDNQAITESLAAMSMNFFATFPPLVIEAQTRNPKKLASLPIRPARMAISLPHLGDKASRLFPTRKIRKTPSSSWSGSSKTTHKKSGRNLAAIRAVLRFFSRRHSRTPRRITRRSTKPCSG